MKIEILFKTPDALNRAIDEAGLEYDWQKIEVKETARKFIQYGEYITVILDTEKQTCTVRNR